MDIKQVLTGEKIQQNQQLINPTRLQNKISGSHPAGFYKSIVITVLVILSSFGLGYTYYGYLVNGLSLWFAFAALVVFSVFSVLEAILEKSWGRRMLMLVFETIAVFIPFYASNLNLIVVAALVFFVFLIWGYYASRAELAYGTQIRFFKVTHGIAAKLVTATLVFMVLFYVLAQGGKGTVFVSENTFDGFFNWASSVFAEFYPAITVNGSFNDFALSVAEEQLQHNSTFEALSPSEQAQALQQATSQLTENFSKNLGVPIASSSTMSGVVYNFIIVFLHGWQSEYPGWFGIGQGIVLFFILRSIGVIFIWFIQLISLLFYQILLVVRFIGISEQPETKEVVQFL